MKRFWFEFEILDTYNYPFGTRIGCGITAFDYEDATEILIKKVFLNEKMPPIIRVIENIDIRLLDQGHVIPNMSSPNYRGVWFPIGYHDR